MKMNDKSFEIRANFGKYDGFYCRIFFADNNGSAILF